MRPHATRQTDWAQLGIGACVLVLSPLALGAALYSMLEPADSDVMRSGGTDAVLPDNGQPAPQTGLPVTPAGGPVAGGGQPLPGLPASAEGRAQVQAVIRDIWVPAAPMPAVASNPPAYASTEGAATQSPPAVAAAAPKRSIRRNAQRQPQPQQQDVIKTWLQQIGLLPPYR